MTTQEISSEHSEGSQRDERVESSAERNQRSYHPTPYEPQVWPVLSDATREDAFQVLTYERLSESQYVVDPMFANFDLEVASRTTSQMSTARLSDYDESGELREENASDEQDFDNAGSVDFEHPHGEGVEVASFSSEDSSTGERLHGGEGIEGDVLAVMPSNQSPKRASHQAGSKAQNIEERVEREVQARLAAAHEEREQMLTQVQESAYTKAREDTKKEYSDRFDTIIEDVRTQASESCRDNEQRAVELAFLIAKKLLGSVVTDRPDYINEVISEALRAAANTEIKSVRVSPQDYEYLSASQSPDGGLPAERAWKLESDDSVGAGCIVTTATGDIDFDLEKSWARMREKVARGPKS